MKLERTFIVLAVVTIVLSVPVTLALKSRTNTLKIERTENRQLQEVIKSKSEELHKQQLELKQKEAEKLELEKKTKEQEAQLQAKLKREADAKVAAARTRTASVAVSGGDCSKWLDILDNYSWNIDVAINVCNAESGGNPSSENPHDGHATCLGSRGLFQIGCDSTGNYAGMFDPSANIAQAYALYASRGWQPWGFTTCRYKVQCY